jgi:hypothetical protein
VAKEASVLPETPDDSPLNGKASTVLPAHHPAIPAELDAKEAQGANGSHHATHAEELPGPKQVYEGADLPALRMALAAPLARETRVVQEIPAAEKADGKTKKWLKRQKELAKFE